MKINLPDIEIQPDWTIPSQVKKIGEEYGEVAEAVAMNDPVSTIRGGVGHHADLRHADKHGPG